MTPRLGAARLGAKLVVCAAAMLGARSALAAELRWAVDPTGGAPYAFADPHDPTANVGFEVELVHAIAANAGKRLGESTSVRTVRGDYARLTDLVERGDADLALNGLDESVLVGRNVTLTAPYYVARECWTWRRQEAEPELERIAGEAVGTLPHTLAESLLRKGGARVATYDGGQGDMFEDLLLGRTRAVFVDEPVARYYGATHRELALAPTAFTTRYRGAVAASESPLRNALIMALDDVLASGEAARIYARWGLLSQPNHAVARVVGEVPAAVEEARWNASHAASTRRFARLSAIARGAPLLARGLAVTILVAVLAMVIAVPLGVALAGAQLFGVRPLRAAARAYVEVVRGTPVFLQLSVLYFGLPQLGVTLAPLTAGVLGLGLNYAASEAENVRAGILSVPASLAEAARMLGLSRSQTMRHVVGPLALRGALPPMTNDFLALLKDSALVSVVTVSELTRAYMTLATSTGAFLEAGLAVGALYFLAGLPVAALGRRLETRLGKHLRTLEKTS
jgi:polar amino acid transport system substrate-binding protein